MILLLLGVSSFVFLFTFLPALTLTNPSSLPQLGDNPDLELSPSNPAGFAHIGAEIKMKDHPTPSLFAGSLFKRDTIVKITSRFTVEEIQAQRDKLYQEQLTLWIK